MSKRNMNRQRNRKKSITTKPYQNKKKPHQLLTSKQTTFIQKMTKK